jgi:hypothetical protein
MRRLSDEKSRQLAALLWRERLKRWLPVAAALVLFAGVYTYFNMTRLARVDQTVEVTQHDGRVTGHKGATGARGASILQVHLDDGRDVEAFSTFRIPPPNGAHVAVAEARHASGRVTYDVVRLFDQ